MAFQYCWKECCWLLWYKNSVEYFFAGMFNLVLNSNMSETGTSKHTKKNISWNTTQTHEITPSNFQMHKYFNSLVTEIDQNVRLHFSQWNNKAYKNKDGKTLWKRWNFHFVLHVKLVLNLITLKRSCFNFMNLAVFILLWKHLQFDLALTFFQPEYTFFLQNHYNTFGMCDNHGFNSTFLFSGEHFRWFFISHAAPCIQLFLFSYSKIPQLTSSLLSHPFSWKVKWHRWSFILILFVTVT